MNTRTIAMSRQGTRMLSRLERMEFLSSKQGDCLEARPAISQLHLVVVGARSPGRPISIGRRQCRRIESAVLCNDAHSGHIGVHILLAPLKEEHIGPSSIGPATIAACCLVEGFDRILSGESCIDNQQAGTLLVLHLEQDSVVAGDLERACGAKLYSTQLGRQRRISGQSAGAPGEKLLLIGAVDLLRGRLAEKSRYLSTQTRFLEPGAESERDTDE